MDHSVTGPAVVTGGAGFVGSHIVEALTPEVTVRVVDDLSSGARRRVPAAAVFHEGDVRDTELLQELFADASVVFHEAAVVSVPQSVQDPLGTHSVTFDGTLSVLEAARQTDTRVVHASSAAIYGHPETVPIDESHPKRPTSPYGIDKLSADQYVRAYHDLYGLETVSLRYFNVYGPGQSGGQYAGVVSVFGEQATADEPITVEGDGNQTRDFVHVDDVVRANLRAAVTDHVGRAYNVGTGREVSILELADVIRETADTASEIVHTDPRDGDIDRSRADIDRARDELGYESRVSLADGLETVVPTD